MSNGDFRTNWSTARELLEFAWRGKNWWLTPLIVTILLMGGLVVFLESSVIAPFLYVLF